LFLFPAPPDIASVDMEGCMNIKGFSIADNLDLIVGRSRVNLTPAQGLAMAEELARKAFRRALTEEAERIPKGISPRLKHLVRS
jgi:hypothetical protein